MADATVQLPAPIWNQQSPIILSRKHSYYSPFPKNTLRFDYKDAPFPGRFVVENGHANFVLDKPHAGDNLPRVMFGDITAELVKIHLHLPSEHDIEGVDQQGEIHLVHRICSQVTGSEVFAVGIFFNRSNEGAACPLLQAWCEKADEPQPSEIVRLDPRLLIPKFQHWYRYEGSLTSDPYPENASWVVLVEPLLVKCSDEQIAKLVERANQPERDIQLLNRRIVLRNFV